MVDGVPRWPLSLSKPIQSDHLLIADQMFGRENSHDKNKCIPDSTCKQLIDKRKMKKKKIHETQLQQHHCCEARGCSEFIQYACSKNLVFYSQFYIQLVFKVPLCSLS